MGERSWIEDAVPAGGVEGQDVTPKSVSVEGDFAGEEPEPSVGDFRDGLAEQGAAGGHEYQVKIDQVQAFISGLSMAKTFRVLGLPEVNAVRHPAKTPTIRSAVELSLGNPGTGALPRGKSRSAVGESSFNVASRKFSSLGPVELHAPPVMTRDERVARKMQKNEISSVAAQRKTDAASTRLAKAISHADVTDFTQNSSDAQPRPASKTLVTVRPRMFQMLDTMGCFLKMTIQIHAPISASPPRGTQIHMMFSLLVIPVRRLPGFKTRTPSAGSGQPSALTRFREYVPPWIVLSDFTPSLLRASRPRRTRLIWTGDVP